MMIYIWISVFIISLFIELATTALVSCWFSAGSLVALILAAFIGDQLIWLQVLLFVAVTVASFLFLRKTFLKKKKDHKTNVDALIGEIGDCQTTVKKYYPGTVKVGGLVWTAEVEQTNDEVIEPGELVEIIRVTGNKIIVKKYKEA